MQPHNLNGCKSKQCQIYMVSIHTLQQFQDMAELSFPPLVNSPGSQREVVRYRLANRYKLSVSEYSAG